MVCKMRIKCYAVYDAKISDYHMAIFDIKHEGAMRQFADAVNDKQTKWNKHPEDYSLWYVGDFDSTKGMLESAIPENLVNATAVMTLSKPEVGQMELFRNGNEEVKEKIN